ncbi:hypothetical protein ACHAXT_002276 [Thalassiosira profunda]
MPTSKSLTPTQWRQLEYDRGPTSMSNAGKAVALVERVFTLTKATNESFPALTKHHIEAVAFDDMAHYAERMVKLQKQFIDQGIPSAVDVGYHYTDARNLPEIRTHGLLTKGDRTRQSVGGTAHGCRFGDGVYTANNAVAFSSYGNVGLIVGRLQGKTFRVTRSLSATTTVDAHTVVGDRLKSNAKLDRNGWPIDDKFNEIVLQSSAQCLPLVKYDSTILASVEGKKCIASLETALGLILADVFRTGKRSSPFRSNVPSTSAPAIRQSSSVDTEAAVKGDAYKVPVGLFGKMPSTVAPGFVGVTSAQAANSATGVGFSFGAPSTSARGLFGAPELQPQSEPVFHSATAVTVSDYKLMLTKFYSETDLAKVAGVDALLSKYKGKEPEMFVKLATRYNKPNALNDLFLARLNGIDRKDYRALTKLYIQVFNPAKAASADKYWYYHKGREDEMFAKLSDKWRTVNPMEVEVSRAPAPATDVPAAASGRKTGLEPCGAYEASVPTRATAVFRFGAASAASAGNVSSGRDLSEAKPPASGGGFSFSFGAPFATSAQFPTLPTAHYLPTLSAAPVSLGVPAAATAPPNAPVAAGVKTPWSAPFESSRNGSIQSQSPPGRKRSTDEASGQSSNKKRKCHQFGYAPSPAPDLSSNGEYGAPIPLAGVEISQQLDPPGQLFSTVTATPFSVPASSSNTFTGWGSAVTQHPHVGPSTVPYQPAFKSDGTNAIVLHSITAMPQYEHKSFEELRLDDRTTGCPSTGFQISAPTANATAQPGPPVFPFGAPAFGGGALGTQPGASSLAPRYSLAQPVSQSTEQSKPSFVPIETLYYVAPLVLAAIPAGALVAPPLFSNLGEECIICCETLKDRRCVALVRCNHIFHDDCIQRALKSKLQCPVCRDPLGVRQGMSPSGWMKSYVQPLATCAGFPEGSIVIEYNLPAGTQTEYHSNPGVRHAAKFARAYLPLTMDGKDLLRRLKYAFMHGLTFSVGTSVTSGRNNVITWASVHHKTSRDGSMSRHGFPDASYFTNCHGELDNLGVPPASALDGSGNEIS